MGKRTWILGMIAGVVVLCSCAPGPPATHPTRLDVRTDLTWCGGVMPPSGEPGCVTSPTTAQFEVRKQGSVVAAGTTGADGHLIVRVPAGSLIVDAADPPAHMNCDPTTVVAVAGETTPVVQNCTIFAP